MAVLRSVKGGAPDRVDGFELAYVTRDGEQARVALAEAWSLRLERAEPVRRFASYRGQRHLPGRRPGPHRRGAGQACGLVNVVLEQPGDDRTGGSSQDAAHGGGGQQEPLSTGQCGAGRIRCHLMFLRQGG